MIKSFVYTVVFALVSHHLMGCKNSLEKECAKAKGVPTFCAKKQEEGVMMWQCCGLPMMGATDKEGLSLDIEGGGDE